MRLRQAATEPASCSTALSSHKLELRQERLALTALHALAGISAVQGRLLHGVLLGRAENADSGALHHHGQQRQGDMVALSSLEASSWAILQEHTPCGWNSLAMLWPRLRSANLGADSSTKPFPPRSEAVAPAYSHGFYCPA